MLDMYDLSSTPPSKLVSSLFNVAAGVLSLCFKSRKNLGCSWGKKIVTRYKYLNHNISYEVQPDAFPQLSWKSKVKNGVSFPNYPRPREP